MMIKNKSEITKQLLYINKLCNNNEWGRAKDLINQICDKKGMAFDSMTKNDFKLYYYLHRKITLHT